MSFDPMGLPYFERVLDSYAFCPSVISTRARTFAAGKCDFTLSLSLYQQMHLAIDLQDFANE